MNTYFCFGQGWREQVDWGRPRWVLQRRATEWHRANLLCLPGFATLPAWSVSLGCIGKQQAVLGAALPSRHRCRRAATWDAQHCCWLLSCCKVRAQPLAAPAVPSCWLPMGLLCSLRYPQPCSETCSQSVFLHHSLPLAHFLTRGEGKQVFTATADNKALQSQSIFAGTGILARCPWWHSWDSPWVWV